MAAVAAAGLIFLAACGGDDGGDETTGDDSDASESTEEEQAATTPGCDLEDPTFVAQANEDLDSVQVFEEPDGEVVHNVPNPWLEAEDGSGVTSPAVFTTVDGEDPADEDWLHVELPVEPSGSQGYIKAEDVTVSCHAYRITIDREAHSLTLTNEGQQVSEYPVGLGVNDHRATQAGTYFTTVLYESLNPAYGPYAFGLNSYTDDPELREEFDGGAAGIHGTNDPESVGSNVSHGCIRMLNEDITALKDTGLPLGVPVEII